MGTSDYIVSLFATIIGSVIMGAIVGVIPLLIAKKKRLDTAGIICFCLCILGNFILGLLLSVPICLISVIVILLLKKKDDFANENTYNPQINNNYGPAANNQANTNVNSFNNPQAPFGNPQPPADASGKDSGFTAADGGKKENFCSHCGTRNDSGSAYCINCGRRIE